MVQVAWADRPGERHWWLTDVDGYRRDYLLALNTVTREDGVRLQQLTLGPLDVVFGDVLQRPKKR